MMAVALNTNPGGVFKMAFLTPQLGGASISVVRSVQADFAACVLKITEQHAKCGSMDVIKAVGRASGILKERTAACHKIKRGPCTKLFLVPHPVRKFPKMI